MTPAQIERLRWIHEELIDRNVINISDVAWHFDMSRPSVSADMKRYLELFPLNAYYDRSKRCYVKAADQFFNPFFDVQPSAKTRVTVTVEQQDRDAVNQTNHTHSAVYKSGMRALKIN